MRKKDSEEHEIEVYLNRVKDLYDLLDDAERRRFAERIVAPMLQEDFKDALPKRVKRFLEIPGIGPLPLMQKFMQLVPEVVGLYVNGFYYSTIASCGVAAERVCYDILEVSEIELDKKTLTRNQKSELYALNLVRFIKLLQEWGLIKGETAKLLHKIRKCRNKYVHPTFQRISAKKDSIRMIEWLFQVIKTEFGPGPGARYTIKNGKIHFAKGLHRASS